MVDESQKVWTIDFPQMVSTSHKDAEFYFNRDQTCIHTIFKRKFSYVSNRQYQLKDISIIRHLDAEVKASGCVKQSADDQALADYLADTRDVAEQAQDVGEGEEEHASDSGDEEQDQRGSEEEYPEEEDVEDLGDIEEEMKAMNVDDNQKPKENIKEEIKIDENEEQEEDLEEVNWEERQEKRKQMKALKKEKLASNRPKYLPVAVEKVEVTKPDEKPHEEVQSDEDSSDQKETDLIKMALKRKYKKKKVFKTNKNHPKQFNAAVKDQMQF